MVRLAIIILLTLPALLMGCNSNSVSLHSFDDSAVRQKVKEKGYEAELPTKLPFKLKETGVRKVGSVFHIEFIREGQGKADELLLRVIDMEIGDYGQDQEFEKVKVNDNKGYFSEKEGGLFLTWVKGEFQYFLTYSKSQSKTEIAKEEFIQVAESLK